MQKILSSALMIGALLAGCGQQKEEVATEQPPHNLLIVRVPVGMSLADVSEPEVRALNVEVSGEQDGTALESLFNEGEVVNVAQALESDEDADVSTEAGRRGRGYNRGWSPARNIRGYNWGRNFGNILFGSYSYNNYSRSYGCGSYNYYPYYSNCSRYGYGCY